jgi:hypothetical protein
MTTTTPPLTLDELRTIVSLCDPNRPLGPGDPLYVPFDEGTPVRGSNARSCIESLKRLIFLKDETCQLFTGFPGTGKTTELKRLQAALNDARDVPTHAIYIDFEEYLDRYTPATIHDVLRTIAYAMDREATIAEGKDPDVEPGYLRRLFTFLSTTDVELQKIGFQAYGASLMLELRNNPTFRQKVETAIRFRFQQFAAEARAVMEEATFRLRRARGVSAERVVVLCDGLEKFSPLRDEDRDGMESSVETLFVQHARLLRLPCHAIYTFPLWLRFRVAELGGLYDAQPEILPMVKITDRAGVEYGPGVEKLLRLVDLRLGNVARIFGDDLESTLLPLIRASGGYPRDLLRMVRQVLIDASGTPPFPIAPQVTQRVLDELSQEYALVVRGTSLPLLRQVAVTHAMPQGDAAEVASFGRLLERWLVLAYRDEQEWFDLHPLVRRAPIVDRYLERDGAT